VDGWLVPPGDPDALARQIEQVVDDLELLRSVGQAASAAVLTADESFALVLRAALDR
jgi:glycosyltransferase involved in cell wall biosynthesis